MRLGCRESFRCVLLFPLGCVLEHDTNRRSNSDRNSFSTVRSLVPSNLSEFYHCCWSLRWLSCGSAMAIMQTFKLSSVMLIFCIYFCCWQRGSTFRSVPTSHQYSNSHDRGKSDEKTSFPRKYHVLQGGKEMFNPYLRHRNVDRKWFDESLTSFYRYVDEQPLLTAEQEKLYGKSIKMWNYVMEARRKLEQELGSNSSVSIEQLAKTVGCSVMTLSKMSSFAYYSHRRLVECNYRLVLSIVSRYRRSGIENIELISVGTSGLRKALRKFDYARGFRFATYATWYVHQSVSDYVRRQKSLTRISGRYIVLLRQIKQYSSTYQAEHGEVPSLHKLSEALDVSEHDINRALQSQLPVTMLHQPIQSTSWRASRISEPLPAGDMLVSSASHVGIEDRETECRIEFEKLMALHLTDVERDVLRLRYGLDDGIEKPIREMGKRYQVSWKKLRDVEQEATAKLQKNLKESDYARILV